MVSSTWASSTRMCWSPGADQMHLNPGGFVVPDGAVDEAVQVEIAAQFAVDPHEQIPVEGRRDPKRIVVGQQQVPLRLDQVGADEKAVARRLRARIRRTISSAPGGSKLPMFDPRNSTSDRPPENGSRRKSSRPTS